MNHNSLKLDGKKILITGVSREIGIGATLAKRLAESGAEIAIHGYSTYDLTVGTNNGAVLNETERIAKQYENLGLKVTAIASSDLETIGNAEKVVEEASEKLNGLDGMILNHAYGVDDEIGKWTAEHIDHHLLINVRASMMMIQAFVKQADTTKDNAIILFSSGQYKNNVSGRSMGYT